MHYKTGTWSYFLQASNKLRPVLKINVLKLSLVVKLLSYNSSQKIRFNELMGENQPLYKFFIWTLSSLPPIHFWMSFKFLTHFVICSTVTIMRTSFWGLIPSGMLMWHLEVFFRPSNLLWLLVLQLPLFRIFFPLGFLFSLLVFFLLNRKYSFNWYKLQTYKCFSAPWCLTSFLLRCSFSHFPLLSFWRTHVFRNMVFKSIGPTPCAKWGVEVSQKLLRNASGFWATVCIV